MPAKGANLTTPDLKAALAGLRALPEFADVPDGALRPMRSAASRTLLVSSLLLGVSCQPGGSGGSGSSVATVAA